MTGSFSSLLESDGHLETILESFHPVCGGDVTVLPNSTSAIRSGIHTQGTEFQSSVSNSNTPAAAVENSERLEGASGSWAASWTDLAIYNPAEQSSTFDEGNVNLHARTAASTTAFDASSFFLVHDTIDTTFSLSSTSHT
ncbi:hypothetical protein B296_00044167 [Ensete ventricosum]|uniref:Uncharacterized protein n=1 Tax=Ensete ventricosum TaxID=4639 RepID=A0A426ZBW0_ENSVE|nr:hypothetical protein B296_00044167 [Ensete ventricosum]